MNVRYFFAAFATACIFASVTTLLAQNREQENITAELRALRHSYRAELAKVVEIMQTRYLQGNENIDGLLKSQIALAEADAAIATDPGEKIAALESSVTLLKKWEADMEKRLELGVGRSEELSKSRAARMYAEIRLLEERERQYSPN